MREKQKFHIWHYKKDVKIKLLPLLLAPFKLGFHCCSPGWFELPAGLPFQPPECWDYQAWETMHNLRSNYTIGKKACATCNVGHGAQSWVPILGLYLVWERVSVLMLALHSRLAGKPLGDSPSSHSARRYRCALPSWFHSSESELRPHVCKSSSPTKTSTP